MWNGEENNNDENNDENKPGEELTGIRSILGLDLFEDLGEISGYIAEDISKAGYKAKIYRTEDYSSFTLVEGDRSISRIYTTDQELFENYNISKMMDGNLAENALKKFNTRDFYLRAYKEHSRSNQVYALEINRARNFNSLPDPEVFEDLAFEIANSYIGTYGLEPFVKHQDLASCGRLHSQDMLARKYFSHVSPEGETFDQRVAKATGGKVFGTGENIAFGQRNPILALDAWINSPGHRENIIRNAGNYMGVGVAFDRAGLRPGSYGSPYYTQVFGIGNIYN